MQKDKDTTPKNLCLKYKFTYIRKRNDLPFQNFFISKMTTLNLTQNEEKYIKFLLTELITWFWPFWFHRFKYGFISVKLNRLNFSWFYIWKIRHKICRIILSKSEKKCFHLLIFIKSNILMFKIENFFQNHFHTSLLPHCFPSFSIAFNVSGFLNNQKFLVMDPSKVFFLYKNLYMCIVRQFLFISMSICFIEKERSSIY